MSEQEKQGGIKRIIFMTAGVAPESMVPPGIAIYEV